MDVNPLQRVPERERKMENDQLRDQSVRVLDLQEEEAPRDQPKETQDQEERTL